MCINLEVSIGAFVASMGCSIYMWTRNLENDRFVAYAFGYAGTMQLLETLLWVDQNCGKLNRTVTEISRWQVALQPLVVLLVMLFINKTQNPMPLVLVFAAYCYLSLPGILTSKGGCSKACCADNAGLQWPWTKTGNNLTWVIFVLALAIPMLYLPSNGLTYFSITVGLFILALVIAHMRNKKEGDVTSGSLWCLFGALVPIAAIFINGSNKDQIATNGK